MKQRYILCLLKPVISPKSFIYTQIYVHICIICYLQNRNSFCTYWYLQLSPKST